MNLQGKSALVTGSSRGIGAAIARRLAAAGATVLVHGSRNAAAAEQVVKSITQSGGEAEYFLADLASPAEIISLFDRLGSRAEQLDILVNNAGIYAGGSLESLEEAQIRQALNVNVLGPIILSQEFVRRSKTTAGRIINISSLAARAPGLNASAYSATKAAVDALTRCWSFELGHRGFTVNSVAPGLVKTEMSEAGIENHERVLSGVALKRIGLPDDIAGVVAFLASDDARWITGQVIAADGGQIATVTILGQI